MKAHILTPRKKSERSIDVPRGDTQIVVERVTDADFTAKKRRTTISVGPEAKLTYIFLLDCALTTSISEERIVGIDRGGSYTALYCYLGGKRVEISSHCSLRATSTTDQRTLVVATASQEIVCEDFHEFKERNGTGRFAVQALLSDAAHVRYPAALTVKSKGHGTDARLSLQGYLLGDHARCSLVPELSIGADDVQVSHAASVSHIDAQQLYYLRTRGLSEAQATHLITNGIIHDFANRIDHQPTKNAILTCVERVI